MAELLTSIPESANGRPRMMRQYELVERVTSYDPDADEALLNRAYVYAHGTLEERLHFFANKVRAEATPSPKDPNVRIAKITAENFAYMASSAVDDAHSGRRTSQALPYRSHLSVFSTCHPARISWSKMPNS